MNVHFLEENHRKKFAILPYQDFLHLVSLAADEKDYQRAVKVLHNKLDKIVDYQSEDVLKNPILSKRQDLGISQRELAKRMKVDPSFISRLEKSEANPSKSTLLKVAQALGCPVEELL